MPLTPGIIKICRARFTALDAQGDLLGTSNNFYVTDAITELAYSPEITEGDTQEVKNGCGATCLVYTAPDTYQRYNLTLTLCRFEPALASMLTGAGLLSRPAVAAALTTSLTGTNNDLTFTADAAGIGGNAIRIRYVDPAAPSAALSVTVAGNDITVNLATSAGSAITSTAAQVKAALDASGAAAALINTANAAGNDGTGVVTAMAYTNLAGGEANPVGINLPGSDTAQPLVAAEFWAWAWDGDARAAAGSEYVRYVFPSGRYAMGDGTLNGEFTLPSFTAKTSANPNWGDGPHSLADTTALVVDDWGAVYLDSYIPALTAGDYGDLAVADA